MGSFPNYSYAWTPIQYEVFYQHMHFHCVRKTILQHNGVSCTDGKTVLHWILAPK